MGEFVAIAESSPQASHEMLLRIGAMYHLQNASAERIEYTPPSFPPDSGNHIGVFSLLHRAVLAGTSIATT
jgi:hypothetical protein